MKGLQYYFNDKGVMLPGTFYTITLSVKVWVISISTIENRKIKVE